MDMTSPLGRRLESRCRPSIPSRVKSHPCGSGGRDTASIFPSCHLLTCPQLMTTKNTRQHTSRIVAPKVWGPISPHIHRRHLPGFAGLEQHYW